jgi:hypothetical protein
VREKQETKRPGDQELFGFEEKKLLISSTPELL